MKRNLTKVLGASLIALSATVSLNLPAKAQVTDPNTTTTAPTTTTTTTYETRNEGFDWGWLGLLGLLGLAGLAGKKRNEEPVRYRDPNAVGTTTTNYRE